MFDSIEIDRTISPNDDMFAGDLDHYFSAGRSGLACIQRALAARGKGWGDPATILDFPCGYGRVLRHLRPAFPRSEITACDLSRDGVDFCRAHFGVAGVYSCEDPARIPLPRDSFDLIWVGSLLTHFDAPRWNPFLQLVASARADLGILSLRYPGKPSTGSRKTPEK
jgi:SAM-dependent methyltransferase